MLHPTVIPKQNSDEAMKAEALKRMNSGVSGLLAAIKALQCDAEGSKAHLPKEYPAMLERAENVVSTFAFVHNIERGKRQLPPAQKG